MAADNEGEIVHESNLGISAKHPVTPNEIYIEPATSKSSTPTNIKTQIKTIACWKARDICFDFDRAFVKPDAKDEFEELAKLFNDHPEAPIAIFGHADPVGKDVYNKTLSENRAQAIYGVITQDPDTWEKVFTKKTEIKRLQRDLAGLGHDPGPIDGKIGPKTKGAIGEYMKKLWPGDKLETSEFLGEGECAYQGCSEFNPVIMFSKEEWDDLNKPINRTKRDAENEPNRRVMVFLFKPGTKIPAADWPCPTAPAIRECQLQFWKPDGRKRRKFHRGIHREFEINKDTDTFACEFYERIARLSPCEKVSKIEPKPPEVWLGFTGNILYGSTCEAYEVNNGGNVRSYRDDELKSCYDEIQDNVKHAKIEPPERKTEYERISKLTLKEYIDERRSLITELIDFKYTETKRGGKPHYKIVARVIDNKTQTELFGGFVEAEYKIGRTGTWYLSSPPHRTHYQVWRKIPEGKTADDYPGKKTKTLKEPAGLNELIRDLCKELRGKYKTITERLKAEKGASS